MRITQIILSKQLGGAEWHVVGLSNELARSHDVQVILRLPPHRSAGAVHDGNILSLLDPAIATAEVGPVFRNRRISRLINAFRPDVIHTHLGDAGKALRAIQPKISVVGTLHGEYKDKCYRAHDALICVSDWQRRTIPPRFSGRVETIPNFIPDRPAPAAAEIQSLRQGLGIPDGVFVVGSVGRMSHEKGFDALIRAFSRASLERSVLVLVGDGPLRPELETMAPPNVIFAGWQRDSWPFHHLLDVFVSASNYESFGLVVLEALCAGVPVLSTASDGPSELLADGAGVLVEIDDVSGMADALRNLASHPERRKQLAAAGLLKSQDYLIGTVVPRIETLYSETIRQG